MCKWITSVLVTNCAILQIVNSNEAKMEAAVEVVLNDTFNQPPLLPSPPVWNPQKPTAELTNTHSAVKYEESGILWRLKNSLPHKLKCFFEILFEWGSSSDSRNIQKNFFQNILMILATEVS